MRYTRPESMRSSSYRSPSSMMERKVAEMRNSVYNNMKERMERERREHKVASGAEARIPATLSFALTVGL